MFLSIKSFNIKDSTIRYTWNSNKPKKKQHLLDENEITYCRLENSNAKLNVVSDRKHPSKLVCKVCLKFQKNPKPPQRKGNKKKHVDFYKSWEWKKLRYDTLKKYGAVCMLCSSEHRIVVDHIKPRKKFPELQLDPDNTQVLCNSCNMGKSNDDYTDFRP